ncbi:unnamed protein product [Ostreobium quekettii]|uniref:Pheophorbide a oxygenase domain-containing protein n=1 Tax=Ostreobium quekettii TaxID=121088 RepID=A0A8S1IWW5_9CHLO|nr:unnamed protein product [Ostreobium quekettii]|eukprot:evm.model.scf_16.12 EVM.evm.TU.scf_16.12   scf_16:154132-155394(+)
MYGHNLLVENVIDPSHMHFAHHGVQGNRDAVKPLRITRLRAKGGGQPAPLQFEVQSLGVPPGSGKRNLDLIFPTAVIYCYGSLGKGALPSLVATTYCTSTSPGRCRLLGQSFRRHGQEALGDWKRLLLRRLATILNGGKQPVWFFHLESNELLDGDMTLLHNQGHTMERMRKVRGELKHQDIYYLAAGADRAVVDLLEWYHDPARGGGGRRGPGGELLTDGPEKTREEVILDRYEQHTRHCRSCSGALHVVESLKPIAQWALVILAATFFSLAFRAGFGVAVLSQGWPLILCAVVCVFTVQLLTGIHRRLRFTPYEHHSR